MSGDATRRHGPILDDAWWNYHLAIPGKATVAAVAAWKDYISRLDELRFGIFCCLRDLEQYGLCLFWKKHFVVWGCSSLLVCFQRCFTTLTHWWKSRISRMLRVAWNTKTSCAPGWRSLPLWAIKVLFQHFPKICFNFHAVLATKQPLQTLLASGHFGWEKWDNFENLCVCTVMMTFAICSTMQCFWQLFLILVMHFGSKVQF